MDRSKEEKEWMTSRPEWWEEDAEGMGLAESSWLWLTIESATGKRSSRSLSLLLLLAMTLVGDFSSPMVPNFGAPQPQLPQTNFLSPCLLTWPSYLLRREREGRYFQLQISEATSQSLLDFCFNLFSVLFNIYMVWSLNNCLCTVQKILLV